MKGKGKSPKILSLDIEIVQPKQVEGSEIPQIGGIWRTYDATDGLPGGVECLLQDRHGYLWLGTSVEKDTGTGLCRYDGAEFITYTTDDGLADNRVMSIYEDHQGRLWLGTPNGISCYDGFDTPSATQPKGQRFTNYTTEDGLADKTISVLSVKTAKDDCGLLQEMAAPPVSMVSIRLWLLNPRATVYQLYHRSGATSLWYQCHLRRPSGAIVVWH